MARVCVSVRVPLPFATSTCTCVCVCVWADVLEAKGEGTRGVVQLSRDGIGVFSGGICVQAKWRADGGRAGARCLPQANSVGAILSAE